MTSEVVIPFWAALLVGTLAGVALLDRLLIPSVRWALAPPGQSRD